MFGRPLSGEPGDMAPAPVVVRVCAFVGPVLLLVYGLLRQIDGLDGHIGPGPTWNVGHTLFLVGFVMFGVVIVGLRRLVDAGTGGLRLGADAAMVAGLVGVGCFVWVTLGDLFSGLDDAAPLPESLKLVGPLAFELGWLSLLALLVVRSPRRLRWWSPALVAGGFAVIAADLDLLSLGAGLILVGLAPLALPVIRPDDRSVPPAASAPGGSSSR